jgi:hypothetical protein
MNHHFERRSKSRREQRRPEDTLASLPQPRELSSAASRSLTVGSRTAAAVRVRAGVCSRVSAVKSEQAGSRLDGDRCLV